MIWNKFKSQFITLLVSIILVVAIFSIYEDLHKVLKISDKESVFGLLILKWFLLSLIFGFNWYQFRKLKSKPKDENETYIQKEYTTNSYNKVNPSYESTKSTLKPIPKQHTNIFKKKKLKTKTDVILKKYLDEDID